MAFVYKITNKTNGKSYIGKTHRSIEKRFKEHISESKRVTSSDRPLYRAILKYGIDNFTISLLEDTDLPEEREIFWIAHYDTYHNGYNATKGADGKPRIDFDKILSEIKENHADKTAIDLSIMYGVDYSYLCYKMKESGLDTSKRRQSKTRKKVKLLDLDIIFESTYEASEYILNANISKSRKTAIADKISKACRKIRKTAFGYNWEFVDIED